MPLSQAQLRRLAWLRRKRQIEAASVAAGEKREAERKCVHYRPQIGLICPPCHAGVHMKDMQVLAKARVGLGAPSLSPCYDGHLLDDARAICPHWERTRV